VRAGLLYAGTERGLFVSFDDGAHWRPLQLNLPVTPVHDLTIHGSSLAIATHGRAFWVLDDLSPLRQWSDAVVQEKAHLFAPAPASHTTFASRPGEMREPGGANPPAGAEISYWLSPTLGTPRPAEDEKKDEDKKKETKPDPLEARIRLDILDADGRLVRSFPEPELRPTSEKAPETGAKAQPEPEAAAEEEEEARGPKPVKLPHLAGLNTFVWDLHYANALAIPRSPLWAGSVSGPKALPGRYQVRLTVDGVSQTQPLEILPDPRGTATPEQLKKQFELHAAVNAELTAVHRAVLDIRAARARVTAAAAKSPALKADAEALAQRMTAIEEALIQPRAHASEDALNYPVRLNNMLAALGSLVADGDAAPTDQDTAMFAELKGECDRELDAWNAIKAKDLPAFEAKTGK
jgi:hypothetical protein